MSKKKLLIMISSIDIGGAEILVLNLCKGLREVMPTLEIHLLTFFKGNILKEEFDRLGIVQSSLNLPHKSSFGILLKKIIMPLYYIIKTKPDIVHTHLLDTDRYGLLAAFLGGVKLRYTTVHNIEKNEELGFKLTRKITSILATKVIFVSKSIFDYYTKANVYPKNKSIVIYNAPGFSNSKTIVPKCFNKQNNSIKLINIGRLNVQKGQIYIIRAMAQLKAISYNFQLHIYGGDYFSYGTILNEEVRKLQLDNVWFHGNSRNIEKVLEQADILVAASLFEGFHMVVVEAMSMGVPVIATDIPPHREILSKIEQYNSFVPPADSDAITSTVLSLIENQKYYELLSKEGILRANDFSNSKLISNHLKLYL